MLDLVLFPGKRQSSGFVSKECPFLDRVDECLYGSVYLEEQNRFLGFLGDLGLAFDASSAL